MTTTANIIDATEATFMEDIIAQSSVKPVLIDFWADWCGPCKNLMPILEGLAASQPDRFVLAKVNADTEAGLVAQFGVKSLPTVVLVKDGALAGHFLGAKSQGEVEAFLDEHLGPYSAEDDDADAAESDVDETASNELAVLQASYDHDPSPASAHALAMGMAAAGRYEPAFEMLLDLLRKDIGWNNNQGRQDIQGLFAECPDKALTAKYQRKLMTLLF